MTSALWSEGVSVKIQLDGPVHAGASVEFTVASRWRLSRVSVFIGRALIHEAQSVKCPYHRTISLDDAAAGQVLRIAAVDVIGNNSEERHLVGVETADEPPSGLIKTSNAVIAWTGLHKRPSVRKTAPAGSVAVGRFQDHAQWSEVYESSGGAALTRRRNLRGIAERFEIMFDWYHLVYVYCIDLYVAHRAFLEIDEYQTIIKERDCGPDKDEPGYDPDIGHRRLGASFKPELKVFRGAGGSLHVWPKRLS
jgi:hypothetical protein